MTIVGLTAEKRGGNIQDNFYLPSYPRNPSLIQSHPFSTLPSDPGVYLGQSHVPFTPKVMPLIAPLLTPI